MAQAQISPINVTLGPNQQQQLSIGGAQADWFVLPVGTGTITSTGLYTAPAVYKSSYVYIYAHTGSLYYETLAQLSRSPVNLGSSAISISVSPSSINLNQGQTKQFKATVAGTVNHQVLWSVLVGTGSIVNGLYTAPSTVTSDSLVTISATSVAAPTKIASATITLAPAAPPAVTPIPTVGVSLRPTAHSLNPGQSKQFKAIVTGSSNTDVTWYLNPAVGSVVNGLYTAPSTVASATTVQLVATSTADPTKTATSTISLAASPAAPPPPPPAPSVSPVTVSVAPGGTTQFSVQNLPSGTTVAWSLSSATGSIAANGLYTAPGTVASQTTVTVTAKNSSTQAVLGTATLTVTASSAPTSVSPATATVAPAGTKQFSILNLPSGATVAWSISPATGSVASSGLYTAPSTVASQTTITVTAKNSSTQTVLGTATVTVTASPTPSVSPAQITLAPAGTKQFTVQNLPSGTTVAWSVSPAVGAIAANGLYTAPATVASQQTLTVTAKNSSTQSSLGTAHMTLQATPPPATNIVLPIEVLGANKATASAVFTVPSGANLSGQLKLWLQIHGLEYQTQASVQANGGAWIPINDSTVTYLGHSGTFGGIGGGFTTLQLTLNLPTGAITQGQNTLTFQFNGTDGISSGFRVLNLNVLTASGSQLISQSSFSQDDPSSWTAPLNNSTDIQAGQALWQTANLTGPGFGAMQAKCGSCHTQDGRDLKYFNYSNLSIQTRSMFHGLTAQQGNQIASYIRSLNVPTSVYARPWNPPYQPGPGIDSRPVSDWAAGAGLDAVVDNDADTLSYVFPGGSTANIAGNAYLNQREIPIMLQLRDWNHWLPTIHPMDAFGTQFTSDPLSTGYSFVRSELRPNDPANYLAHYTDISIDWLSYQIAFLKAYRAPQTSTNWADPAYGRSIYSVGQWMMVKSWEINQEFGLEGMAKVVFGPQAASRAWFSNQAFETSPFMLGIPRPTPGLGNGTAIAHIYDSFIWYQAQLILNDGNGMAQGTWPIDRGYSLSYLTNDLTWNNVTAQPRVGTAGLFMEWMTKILQGGDDPNDASPYFLVAFPAQVSTWSEVTPAQRTQLMNIWDSAWLGYVKSLTQAQLFTAPSGVSPVASTVFSATAPGSFTGDLAHSLPLLNYFGADPTVLNQIAQWGTSYWPSFNWAATISTPCKAGNLGEVKCK